MAVSCPGPMHSVGTVLMDTGEVEERMSRQKLPVGLAEVAEMFDVDKNTPTRWLYRSRKGAMNPRFPEPDGHVSATVPYWWDTTIERWGKASGRKIVRRPTAAGMVDVLPGDEAPADDVAVPDVVPDELAAEPVGAT